MQLPRSLSSRTLPRPYVVMNRSSRSLDMWPLRFWGEPLAIPKWGNCKSPPRALSEWIACSGAELVSSNAQKSRSTKRPFFRSSSVKRKDSRFGNPPIPSRRSAPDLIARLIRCLAAADESPSRRIWSAILEDRHGTSWNAGSIKAWIFVRLTITDISCNALSAAEAFLQFAGASRRESVAIGRHRLVKGATVGDAAETGQTRRSLNGGFSRGFMTPCGLLPAAFVHCDAQPGRHPLDFDFLTRWYSTRPRFCHTALFIDYFLCQNQ